MCGVSPAQIKEQVVISAKNAGDIVSRPSLATGSKTVKEVTRARDFLSGKTATQQNQAKAQEKLAERNASLNAPSVPTTPVTGPSIDNVKRRRSLLTQDSPFDTPSTILT